MSGHIRSRSGICADEWWSHDIFVSLPLFFLGLFGRTSFFLQVFLLDNEFENLRAGTLCEQQLSSRPFA
jgi:hypothetical protein